MKIRFKDDIYRISTRSEIVSFEEFINEVAKELGVLLIAFDMEFMEKIK